MLSLFTDHRALDSYYAALAGYDRLSVTHESGVRKAFGDLLDVLARPVGWTLVLEETLANRRRPDGTLYDANKIPRGYWEAKDTRDDLDAEVRIKIGRGYPLNNTIFEDTRRAILYQNERRVYEADLTQKPELAALLDRFFTHTTAEIDEFHAAIQTFQQDIPELAAGLMRQVEEERAHNPTFVAAFNDFHELCRNALNPAITAHAIEEMLCQHLLTERLFRTVFNNPDFTRKNVIAAEIETVIDALTRRSFSREEYLRKLDYFYLAIERTARTIHDWAEKQGFLNTVYERFFQGFSKSQADTHGIVYTPQAIVDFMCASVDEVLQREFGKSLSSEGVCILDPCTGTGNFIVNLLRRINGRDLSRKYRTELFCNEVMLLPYYIAALNIEHAYYQLAGEYEAFEGLCFADTLDMAEDRQTALFTEENTQRVQRQKDAEITVILGNPPYNVGQQNENDNNKNRRYKVVDGRVAETYAKSSKASNKNKIGDAYVKFFRWATDRLQGRDGIVCFVSNNGFLNGIAFDGMRQHLSEEFTTIYHLDCGGNVRRNPRLSGTIHNVFSIQVGVGITILVRRRMDEIRSQVFYHAQEKMARASEKLAELQPWHSITDVPWHELTRT